MTMTDSDAAAVEAVADVPLSEHTKLLLAIHKAMRADARRLPDAVGRLSEGDADGARGLAAAFAALTGLIHDHHWTEDDVLYPFLMQHVDTFESDAVRLEDDHAELDASMARLGARFRLLSHTASPTLWADAHGHAVDEAAVFGEVLVEHLDREESIVVPAVEEHLSDSDQLVLQKQVSKATTFHHMRTTVPWIIANATAEEEAELRANAPRLLGVLQDHMWDKAFRRTMAPLYRQSG